MKQIHQVVFAFLVTAVFGQAWAAEPAKRTESSAVSPASKQPFHNIGVQEFEKLRRNPTNVVLDVRTPKEFAAGHVPGAVNLDVNSADFEKKAAVLDPKKTYLVHCGAGVRSVKACEKMSKLKLVELYNLEGGFKAWESAGHKAER